MGPWTLNQPRTVRSREEIIIILSLPHNTTTSSTNLREDGQIKRQIENENALRNLAFTLSWINGTMSFS
jgi:hypothetical protein